jgi:hypothetical protein
MLTASLPFESENNERRKIKILSCRFNSHPALSAMAQRLFSSIFVDAKVRARLADLRKSEFSLAYEVARPHFIDLKK